MQMQSTCTHTQTQFLHGEPKT